MSRPALRISVVLITRNEAPRLRLTLAALARERSSGSLGAGDEVIVVDDGSTDTTPEAIAHSKELPLQVIRNERPLGRAAARNLGARAATGEVLLFSDGDVLFGPGAVDAHRAAHQSDERPVIGRGATFHLRCTRHYADPERGIEWPVVPGARATVRRPEDKKRELVTSEQVREAWAEIERRAEPGIYHGGGPRAVHEMEERALFDVRPCRLRWMAVAAQNLSVRREQFIDAGGFDPELTLNEQRELALRLCEAGASVEPVAAARSYHLTHRAAPRDPFSPEESSWERHLYQRHPRAEVLLLPHLWLSVLHDPGIPEELRILSIHELAEIVGSGREAAYLALRGAHPKLRWPF